MDDYDYDATVMWREGTHRCELWKTDGGTELRVYISDVMTYREPVRFGTGGLRQAAKLLADVQRSIHSLLSLT